MTKLKLIEKYENEADFRFPEAYRKFLINNEGEWFENEISFNDKRGHFVERFLTIENIIQNDKEDCLGIPDYDLIFIGECSMTIYTYICVGGDNYGAIYGSDLPDIYKIFDDFSEIKFN
jgi:hypothetical protein